jgi:putative tricarboxylic transport membrane protein
VREIKESITMSFLQNGLTRRKTEFVTSGIIIALALLTLWDSIGRGMGWNADGPQSGYFPGRIAIVMLIASIFILYNAFKASDEVIVTGEQMSLISKIFLPLLVYIAAIAYTGIYLASAVFLAFFMVWVGKFSYLKAIFAGVLTAVISFVVFEIWFRVPLPKGFIENALGF